LIDLRKRFKTNPKYWYALHRPRRKEWYDEEKIITPEISFGCNMTLDKKGLVHNATVYSFLKKSSVETDNRYLLAILNSKLTWFFLKSTGCVLRGGFFRFKTRYMEPFHIPKANPEVEKQISERVESILELRRQYHELSSKLFNRIMGRFKITSTKSGDGIHKLSFNALLAELAVISKEKLSVQEQDEWEDYFNRQKTELLRLESEIGRLDSQVNRMVYDLYALDETEKRLIEDTYP
jgi:hypothetical protein